MKIRNAVIGDCVCDVQLSLKRTPVKISRRFNSSRSLKVSRRQRSGLHRSDAQGGRVPEAFSQLGGREFFEAHATISHCQYNRVVFG